MSLMHFAHVDHIPLFLAGGGVFVLRFGCGYPRFKADMYAGFPTPTSQYRLAREDLPMYADRSLAAPVCVQQVKNLLSNLGSCGYIC